jgi:hypothetical protein
MGLDMYAVRRIYVKNWNHMPAEKRYSVQVNHGGKPVPGVRSDRITWVEEELMYWRKANHIHAWFVDNVQNGVDDCGNYDVSEKKLRELLSACEEVIRASKLVDGTIDGGTVYDKEHPNGLAQRVPGKVIEDATVAKRLLPTRHGFFFGSDEYDEFYLENVVATRDWIVRTLAEHESGAPTDIYYHSSW